MASRYNPLNPVSNHNDDPHSKNLSQWGKKNAKCLKCAIITQAVATVGLLIAIVVLLAAGYAGSDMMAKTSESTIAMRKNTEKLEHDIRGHIDNMLSKFPPNQEELALKQVFGIIENVHKITSRTEFLLNHLEPNTLPNLITSVDHLVSKVELMVQNVDPRETTKLMMMIGHVQELIASITPAQIQKVVNGVGETSEHLGHMSGQAEQAGLLNRVINIVIDFEQIADSLKTIHKLSIELPELNTKK